MRDWILLVYKVPNEPSAGRVYVWRKLKKLAAILLHDAVWVLPATSQTREQLRWLAAEIEELKGEASLWEAKALLGAEEEALIGQFQAQVEAPYKEIQADLKRKNRDLAAIARKYQQVQAQDYFGSELGKRVREALIAARGGPS